jgi:ribonuclease HI
MSPMTLPQESIATLERLAQRLGLADFDLLLVGDGSGTVYDRPAGWACVAYDRRKRSAVLHAGATSGGTNNFAELFPYVQALWHHHQDHDQAPTLPVRVSIVSDSELTVRCGSGRYARRANGCLWAAVSWFEQNGYQLSWRHVPRNSSAWGALTDAVAGRMRLLMAEALADAHLCGDHDGARSSACVRVARAGSAAAG